MMTLTEAACAMRCAAPRQDVTFCGVSTDTRKINPNELFVALHGPNFNGDDFIDEAFDKGAVAAVVSKTIKTTHRAVVLVEDTLHALGQLAAYWRKRFNFPVLAITGSNGKTTVKEMTAAILAQQGPGLATIGNLNNEIGVPLTVLRMTERDHYAIIEMGANHAGEIATLSRLVRPDVALVNNAAAAHLAGFGTIKDVVAAKSEIFSGLVPEGVAIINWDDAHAQDFLRLAAPHRCISFGFSQQADINTEESAICETLTGVEFSTTFTLHTSIGERNIILPLIGKHNVRNALAASSTAVALGFSLDDIKNGLESMKGVCGRLEMKQGFQNLRVIDDTYNANPASFKAAIDVLAGLDGTKVLVLGDMAELGDDAKQCHEQVGEWAREAAIDALYATGELSREAVSVFGLGARHFSSGEELVTVLRNDVSSGRLKKGILLVKGSRSMQMERVVQRLLPHSATTVAE